ncbi:hypothetical protein WK11_05405 [Burkholderia ubonensis]|uniref:Uncharacterized protein n=1 Tax=Burkholderia ubonensis TaxID=101571 RepID=A0ABD4ECL2_9BURK|nr:hypothetical protein [Burkholderia ubonensis]KVN92986.1 hypothetical protein WJ68_30690 [Burkholderia ubonensis]KVO35647.1 hypothetical protein WJ76_13385 [Burkholderia ubonensis]KVR09623.1 hypothetical protein WK11_05405 [Burkholderia ubonensis]KVZ64396.1 hypothetical protein WL19_26490 [Burkholderia ubonensis]KVZ96349.1 hypothetical protein WL24_25520 [Burkholderia ubonensis]
MNTTGNPGGQDGDAVTGAQAAKRDVAQRGAGAAAPAAAEPRAGASKAGARSWPVSRLRRLTDSLKAPNQIREPEWPGHASMQSVQAINAEAASYATTQIAVGPNMMITQAGGLVAQAAANYFEASTSLAIAGKSVLMKDLAQKTVDEDVKGMAMDAMGLLLTDLFVATAAMVAGAAEAIEGEAASIALDKIDESLQKYQALLDKKGG